jgi:PAS domain S-box-containing protein
MMKFFSRGKASPDNQNIRAELFDSFSDGIIILDDTDVILDMNPAAEAFFGLPVSRARGNPVDMLLENWKSIAGVNEAKEVEFRGSIHLNKQWRFISVRTNKLEKGGRVIILRDITDRRDTHEVRQHAREEMFNLLRSIFKSTNTSQSSNDLFRDVLFQIAYTFRADSGVISLVETLEDSGKFKYTLMARQGMLVQDNEALVCLYSGLETSGWSENFHEPLVISDAARNMHFARLVDGCAHPGTRRECGLPVRRDRPPGGGYRRAGIIYLLRQEEES